MAILRLTTKVRLFLFDITNRKRPELTRNTNFYVLSIIHHIGRRTPSPPYHRRRYESPLRDHLLFDKERMHSTHYNNMRQPQPDSTINDNELSSLEYNQSRYRYTSDGENNFA